MSTIAGYVVAGREYPDPPGINIDWDGLVHLSLDSAQRALRDCHGAGYSGYAIYALASIEVTA